MDHSLNIFVISVKYTRAIYLQYNRNTELTKFPNVSYSKDNIFIKELSYLFL